MSIEKRKNSKYYRIRIYIGMHNGRRKYRNISTRLTDINEARILEANYRLALRGRITRDRLVSAIDDLIDTSATPGLALSEVWDVYIKQKTTTISGETIRTRSGNFRRFLAFLDHRWPSVKNINEVSRQVGFDFSEALAETGIKGKTFNNIKGDLSAIFNSLLHRSGLAENIWSVVPNWPKTDSVSYRPFTQIELDQIYKKSKNTDYYGAVVIALYTGLRFKDVALLRWDSIQQDCIKLTPHKTKKHKISVTIPTHQNIQSFLKTAKKTGKYIFPELARYFHSTGFKRYFFGVRILHPLKILSTADALVGFHSLRHNFATNLEAAGVPQHIRMRLGGWTNETIAEIYNHDLTAMRQAILQLE